MCEKNIIMNILTAPCPLLITSTSETHADGKKGNVSQILMARKETPNFTTEFVPRVKWCFHLLSNTVILTDGRKWHKGKLSFAQ